MFFEKSTMVMLKFYEFFEKILKKLLIFSILVLISGFYLNDAFGQSSDVLITTATGSGAPGCESGSGCYLPSSVNIFVGDRVLMKNTDSAAHTFTSGTPDNGPDGVFDTSLLMTGASFEWKPSSSGKQPYFCMVHPWMTGVINVQSSSSSSSSSPSVSIPSSANVIMSPGSGAPGCENTNSCYSPATFSAGKGSTVTWFNADSAAHTVTSGTPGNGPSGRFDSSLLMVGGSFSHKFSDDGVFPYFCMVHPWMTGKVAITRSGPIIGPQPTLEEALNSSTMPTTPAPTPATISVSTDDYQYSPDERVTVSVSTSTSTNVVISVTDPSGDLIVLRSISTDSRGNGSLQFKLPDSLQSGSYVIDSTATISGTKISDSTSFTVKFNSARINIISLQPTDQQGNSVSSFTKGKLGFVKVILNSDSNVNSLVTINLFDSDLTSLGIGSFKTTLSSGQSEMTLSFFIPPEASSGSVDIYANVLSDWPSQGGVPLTGESSTQVRLQ